MSDGVKEDEGSPVLSAYITAGAVRKHFSTVQERKKAALRMKRIGITKAFVEFYRSGLLVDQGLLADARVYLEGEGLQVSGGIATTHGEGFTERSTVGRYWICYTSEKSRKNLERAMRIGAKVFDEIIVDDFLCTGCKCPRCKEKKGGEDWTTFYGNLMVQFAREAMINPAKEENPGVRLIVKYPQWYDRLHVFGYDVVRQSDAFDAVWVGTEIRDPRKDYVYQYQPFSNYTYIRSIAGHKVEGAWFDQLWCYPEVYVEQAYQSLLAGAPEITLFSYSPENYDEKNPNMHMLMQKRPLLQRIRAEIKAKSHFGIEAYKPPGSDPLGEAYIFDYLGLMGLPIIVSARLPSTRSLVLSAHALADPHIEEFLTDLDPGHTVLATSGFVEGLRTSSVTDLFGLSGDPVRRKAIFAYRFLADAKECLSEERVFLRSYLRPDRATVLASARTGKAFPILTVNREGGNTYLAACLDTFRYLPIHGAEAVTTAEPVSLIHLPREFLDLLRGPMLSPYGLSLSAPPKVALYLYSVPGNDDASLLVVENFSDQEAEIEIDAKGRLDTLTAEKEAQRTHLGLRIHMPRRDLVILSRDPVETR